MKSRLYLPVCALGGFVALAVFAGCSKKEAEPEAAAPVANTNAAPAATPVATASQAEVSNKIQEADRAMKSKDFETAARAMVTVQLSNVTLTEKQGYDQVNRMRDLMHMITEAQMNGDPRAQRAAEMLRQVQHMRTR